MKKENGGMLPVILGIGIIAVIVAVVLVFSFMSKGMDDAMSTVNVPDTPATEAADDGVLKDYEKEGYVTLPDYKSFKAEIKKEESDDWEGAVFDEYVEGCKVEKYPDGAVEEANADLHRQYNAFAGAAGMTYTELLESYGTSEEDMYDLAKDTVASQMIAKTIAFREGLKFEDSELNDYIMKLMELDKSDVESEDQLLQDYLDTVGSRPKDDIYVLLAGEYLAGLQ